jgi:hypothetical protein
LIPDDVRAFLDKHIRSLWALELVLLLHRDRTRSWSGQALVKELRASELVVLREVPALISGGLVETIQSGSYRARAENREASTTIASLEKIYRDFPVAIIRHIALQPNRGLREFADAFKLKKE